MKPKSHPNKTDKFSYKCVCNKSLPKFDPEIPKLDKFHRENTVAIHSIESDTQISGMRSSGNILWFQILNLVE